MKTLWIGCSHSAGIYDDSDRRVSLFGIPHLVSQSFNPENWKMIAAPGNGIIEFSCIISYMDREGLLDDYSNIILQLTNEPRLISFDPHGEMLKYKQIKKYALCDNNERECPVYLLDNDETHPKDFFNLKFSLNPVMLYDMYKKYFSNSTNALDMTEDLTKSLALTLMRHIPVHFQSIVNIAEQRNIKLSTFNFSEADGISRLLKKGTYEQYDILDGESIMHMVEKKLRDEYFVNGRTHPTQQGVDFAVETIKTVLISKGVFT